MIFLTLGTQLPFDRLLMTLDEAAAQIDEEVFGQIGGAGYRPANFAWVDFLSPAEFAERMAAARIVVAHAGIGTILTGLKMEKPLILMPRRAALGEHRNDHQLATVAQLRKTVGIHIVESVDEMCCHLRDPGLAAMRNSTATARDGLISAVRREVFGDAAR
ncbi:UDP-N-acetylglucosamine transferase subunit ALG13 [Altererythrobacter atlanticus]|uniref:Uncharacterized protein n=1 Tax=Croceibacterium atlanticum TaxID=1267766 RepID=A0A0F7KQI2_9SPHN|nr:glycosyltransferase [Croceibacterium atlanticum]AKH41366.1 hypothetical protein WYH_00302 [Croceibacterium atlanticum]MBB5734119.1 UDP-N-acetylglucosamine transferase subunit ALG13 [Croceibacterium atlanticum]